MSVIYYADATTKQFKGSSIVPDDYVLKENETFEDPTGKHEPAKLVGTSWQDATEEEHAAWVKAQQAGVLPVVPSAGDKAINSLGLQLAQVLQESKALSQSVNVLGLQVAKLSAQSNVAKENGGN